MSADSDCKTKDPQVAAMAASSAGADNLIEIPVSSTPIAAMPLSFCKMDVVEPSPSTPPVNKQKRQRNGGWTVVSDRKSLKLRNTDWLPLDWTVRRKDRLNGDTAGRSDHEFIAPNGVRCRSKKEFLDYTEHGILPKATSNALRRKLSSQNVFETHRQNNENEEKIEDEEKEDDEQKEAEEKEDEEKVEQEAPASGAEQMKGWL